MAVTNEELKTLQPGDTIVIISEEEAKDGRFWYGERAGWSLGGDPDYLAPYNMNSFCGKALTVMRFYHDRNSSFVKVTVEETGFWWKADFISEIIRAEEINPIEKDDLLALIYGGET